MNTPLEGLELPLEHAAEYDAAAEWCAKRGFAGKIGDPLPANMASDGAFNADPEAFQKRIREFVGAINATAAHDHSCHCGTSSKPHHETGEGGCVREMTEAPIKQANGNWLVGGHEITWCSLFEQRCYFQHPCGCWSKAPESTNSISV